MSTRAVRALLDTRPLTEPLAGGKEPGRPDKAATSVGSRVAEVLLVLAGFTLMSLGMVLGLSWLAVFGVVWVLAVLLGRKISAFQDTRAHRLERFAAANGFVWQHQVYDPRMPGMLFPFGSLGIAHDHIRMDHPRRIEVANYERLTNSVGLKESGRWGYAAVKLSRPLPHIVLDAVGNNSLLSANLPSAFKRDQRLSLEGDFDTYFRLYCPAGYERDALYLFTPDVMARFVDNAAALDVEIVDDWLFLYSTRDLSTVDAKTWEWLFSAIDAVLDKVAQWERWRDERLDTAVPALPRAVVADDERPPAPTVALGPAQAGVARPGRRLRPGGPWVAISTAGAVTAVGIAWATGLFDHLGEIVR